MSSFSSTLVLMFAAVVALTSAFECDTLPPSSTDPSGLTYGPTCSQIDAQFPDAATPTPPEDVRVICPFIRMLHRLNVIKSTSPNDANKFWTRISGVSSAAKTFGCAHTACGVVATAVGVGQKLTWSFEFITHALDLDVFRLWDAPGISHDCGLGFTLGERQVNDTARAATLQRLSELATPEGHITYDNLVQVKAEACARDYAIHKATGAKTINKVDEQARTLEVSGAGDTELGLIFGYCGGVDRGYVRLEDVDALLHAQLPEGKTKFEINIPLFSVIDG